MRYSYTVFVDDFFHFMEENDRYKLGDFATADEAIDAARRVVDAYLRDAFRPGLSAASLLYSYTQFGEGPFILTDDIACRFVAWEYARERSEALCGIDEEPFDAEVEV